VPGGQVIHSDWPVPHSALGHGRLDQGQFQSRSAHNAPVPRCQYSDKQLVRGRGLPSGGSSSSLETPCTTYDFRRVRTWMDRWCGFGKVRVWRIREPKGLGTARKLRVTSRGGAFYARKTPYAQFVRFQDLFAPTSALSSDRRTSYTRKIGKKDVGAWQPKMTHRQTDRSAFAA